MKILKSNRRVPLIELKCTNSATRYQGKKLLCGFESIRIKDVVILTKCPECGCALVQSDFFPVSLVKL